MDEYAEYIYNRNRHMRQDFVFLTILSIMFFRNVNPGDVKKQVGLREKLACKPFKWYIYLIFHHFIDK
jgi:hypothetical protein